MSELAKSARKANREKAERLIAEPVRPVDASGYRAPPGPPPEEQTGCKPITARKFKRGGKVEGEHAVHHAGKKPRTGNKRHYADGGDAGSFVPTSRMAFQNGPSRISKAAGLKTGGKAHSDEKQDIALIKKEVKPSALKGRSGKTIGGALSALSPALMIANAVRGDKDDGKKRGGRAERKHGGDCDGGRIARKSGGRAGKGKVDVNIVIATGKDHQPQGGPMAGPPPAPHPVPVAMPPAGGPPPGGPPPMPMGGPMAGPPPMPRKRGGRAHMTAGAGSGEGRLEKVELQEAAD